MIGTPTRRTEDPRLVTGRGRYLADLIIPGAVWLHLVRSPYPSAQIAGVDLAAARSMPGVVAVYAADDLPPGGDLAVYAVLPGAARTPHPPLARGVVRFVGEPVVAILAEDPSAANDAAALVEIDYEPLAAVPDLAAALADGAPAVQEAAPDNVALTKTWEGGDAAGAFAGADHVVELRIRNGRVAPLPLEPRGAVARYDPSTDEYTLWSSTQVPHRARSEIAGALGIPESALRVIVPDVGGGFGAKVCAYREDVLQLLLARLSGRPVRWVSTRGEDLRTSMHARDSLVDAAAAFSRDGHLRGLRVRATFNVGAYMQPLALIPPARSGVLVPGAYAVDNVLSEVRCVYTNTAPTGPYRGAGRPEASFVIERVMDLAARDLGIDPAELRRRNFVPADAFPYRTPTGQVYDSGDYAAALDRMLELADYPRLRAAQAEARARGELVGIGLATFVEPSAPERSVTLGQVAATAYAGMNLPAGEEPGLEATVLYAQNAEMFGFGAYLAVVRIDRDTGHVGLERLVGVDDSGVIINPLLAEGQIQGGIAQGIGQALLERVVYDENGQLVTGSLMDYAAPLAASIPPLDLEHVETPSPLNPLGAKGVGEAGAVGAPPAIINAVVDALSPHGVRHVDMPATDPVVWRLIEARGSGDSDRRSTG